ncbi:MAG: hypothetical protein FJ298_06285 [Planctomycetes bacterium]|nr:hypothetical protein [Planctomycetota bacterium]
MKPADRPFAKLSPLAVRLPALWILGVALIKLVAGSPADIPLFIRENPLSQALGEQLNFQWIVAIELAFSLIALFVPRIGWWLVSTLLTVFVGVLLKLIAEGSTSCGCFGGAITLSPYAMLAIDGSLFAFLLFTRPWQAIPAAPLPLARLVPAALVGAVTPFMALPLVDGWRKSQTSTPTPTNTTGAAVTTPTRPAPLVLPQIPNSNPGTSAARPNSADGLLVPSFDASGRWKLPDSLPRWARLRPPEWIGKSIHDTDLAVWMDTRTYPEDGTWILYLETCSHCADYLKTLEASFASDPKLYVFVRLATDKDEAEGVVTLKPPGEQAALPKEVTWVVGPELPPWELVLEGGVVRSATRHGD